MLIFLSKVAENAVCRKYFFKPQQDLESGLEFLIKLNHLLIYVLFHLNGVLYIHKEDLRVFKDFYNCCKKISIS